MTFKMTVTLERMAEAEEMLHFGTTQSSDLNSKEMFRQNLMCDVHTRKQTNITVEAVL